MGEGAGSRRRHAFEPLPEWVQGPSTRLVHAARRPERNAGAVVAPIYQTSTFRYPEEFSEAGETGAYLYTRHGNPSQEAAAEPIRLLERAESARVFASGMGAITATLLSYLKSGDELVALADLYGGTLDLLTRILPRLGVSVRWVHGRDASEPERVIGQSTRLLFLETPTNPTLRVHDIRRWADAADAAGALLIVDNTMATPINQTPLALGADLVVHSATKYLSGHTDTIAGAVCGPSELLDRIDETHASIGTSLDPFAAFLLARGLKTLALRVARQNENARRIVETFRDHPAISRLHYPGLASEGEEALALRQMRGRGGVVSLSLAGGTPAVRAFLHALKLIQVASSFGGVESLVSSPRETSHRHLSDAERAERGIDDGLVRLALGIEHPEDLVRDIDVALSAAASPGPRASN